MHSVEVAKGCGLYNVSCLFGFAAAKNLSCIWRLARASTHYRLHPRSGNGDPTQAGLWRRSCPPSLTGCRLPRCAGPGIVRCSREAHEIQLGPVRLHLLHGPNRPNALRLSDSAALCISPRHCRMCSDVTSCPNVLATCSTVWDKWVYA